MKLLWTLVKVALACIVLIPVSLIVLGLFGTVIGLAMMFLRLAVLGLLAYVGFKFISRMFRGPAQVKSKEVPRLAPVDPYYQQAMRELDLEIPEASRGR